MTDEVERINELEERIKRLEKEQEISEEQRRIPGKIIAIGFTLLSIPQFLRGEFLMDWTFQGIAFGIIQLGCGAVCAVMLFNFVRSRVHVEEDES